VRLSSKLGPPYSIRSRRFLLKVGKHIGSVVHISRVHASNHLPYHELSKYNTPSTIAAIFRAPFDPTSVNFLTFSATMSRYDPEDPLNQVQAVYSRYSDSRGSKEYENSFQATEEIVEIIKEVRDSITPDSSFGEKVRAMSVILQISNEVLEGDNSTLGSEIRKSFYQLPVGSSVTHIFNILSPEELGALQADGALADEMIGARQAAEDFAIEIELDDVIDSIAMQDYMSEDEEVDEVHGSSSQQPIDLTLD
jgi:hypothetical protein